MMFWLAMIEGGDLSAESLRANLSTSLVIESKSNTRLGIGHASWDQQSPSQKLQHVQVLFKALADLKLASLKLPFSGQITQSADAVALVEAWQETAEPPILSIIQLVLGAPEVGHKTYGLVAFADYELSVRFNDPVYSRDAARDLARLARYVLAHGDFRQNQEMIGVNGPLTLPGPTDPPPSDGYWFTRVHAQFAH